MDIEEIIGTIILLGIFIGLPSLITYIISKDIAIALMVGYVGFCVFGIAILDD